ncbi:putative threonine--tRNA ligase 1 [uncultured archaeon]|nr:putative threonine--tRNA ligase 1 [uncultured archaeon]
MKILSLHTDYIKFKPLKKALKSALDLSEDQKKEKGSKEALVIFTAVEKGDNDIKKVVEKFVENVKDIAKQVNAKNIVLYPYAHLSSNLAAPDLAQEVLDEAEKSLKKSFTVVRAPFGYYKEFEMKVKGHPLSELSREIKVESEESLEMYNKLMSFLDKHKAKYRLIDHPPEGRTKIVSPMRGNKLSQAAHCIILMVKNKKDEKKYVLAVVPGDSKVDFEAIKKLFSGTYVGFADQEVAEKLGGSVSGSILPFSFSKELELVVDPRLLESNELFFNAARLDRSLALNKDDYVRITKPRLETISKLDSSTEPTSNLVEEKYDPQQLLRQISKSKLDSTKLKDNDHRILGQQMDLFSFSEVAPGMVFLHNNGLIIYNELINYWRDLHRKHEYQEISTPQILDKKLWLISGHWDKYKDNIFLTEYEKRSFAVKPMNCPGGMLVYKNRPKSYKELPLRVGELGIVHRQELSGVLAGLFRVIKFTQDDAHIFCTEDQLEDEIIAIMNLVDIFYKQFKVELDHVELSTRPEKRIGADSVWDVAEKTLENVLKKKKMKYKINAGDGAFYGPKIDFHIKDSLGRTWQTATIQLDFAMPERFELEYADKDGKMKRPVMLHRVIYGSLERFMGILLEHTNGRLPTWLAPVQVRVLSFTDRNEKYAKEIVKKLGETIPNLRLDADFTQSTVQSKVKEAEIMRIPYIIVVGDREEKEKTLAVRVKGSGKIQTFKVDEFVKQVKEEVEKRL